MKGMFLYSSDFAKYDFGPSHPMQQTRLVRTFELLKSYKAFETVVVREPVPCSVNKLESVHSAEFIECVQRCSRDQHHHSSQVYGLGAGDTPAFPGIWEASLLYSGASWMAAEAVADGMCQVAMNLSGGLHHSQRDRASGFCVFNDCAIAINRLRERFDRIAYVDIDVHHGDGVQNLFYDDPSVLTLSIHQSGRTLYPGTGFVGEVGATGAEGASVNLPVWPYTGDEIWLDIWSRCALPILKSWNPEAIVLQLGADAHYLDPLAHICLTTHGWLRAVTDIKALGTPVVALGGGGYCRTTVPRMWALAASVLFDTPLNDVVPKSYSECSAMPTLHDHVEFEFETEDLARARLEADRTIRQVESLLFPLHGLGVPT